MYTVEFKPSAAVVVTLDEHDAYDDVELTICDDETVFIRQTIQDVDEVNVIYMSYGQLLDLMASMHSTEGAYRIVGRT